MFKKIFIVWGLLSCILMAGCSTDLYDFDELNDRMDTFDKRLAELEDWCKETNTNIHSLKSLVESLLQHDVITGVTPILNENVVTGYTITFLNADPITLYHGLNGKDGQDGEDGKDGYTPLIGVKQDADGIYYWTLDGEWMTDAQGAKIKAQGEKGADGENGAPGENGSNGTPGKDGITPQLKIEEDGYWYVSYDHGQTWTKLYKAVGEDGQDGNDGAPGKDGVDGTSFFESIDTTNSNYVLFKFSDGSTLKVPTWTAFEALQTQCNQMNANLTALQTAVAALENKDYVLSVTPLMQNAVEVGYTITFSKSGAVTIYHGTDGQPGVDGQPGTPGQDGYTPVIAVKQDTDGVYYWTVDGEWLLDNGQKIKVHGNDGIDGTDGITPKLKIENGFWYVSYDGGNHWTKMSDENATSSNNVFKSVTVNNGNITFVLNDDSEVVVPVYQEIGITFDQKNNLSGIAANQVIYIPYTLTHATEKTKVEASSDGQYAVRVVPTDKDKGNIVVTAPGVYVDGHVLVHIDSGVGYSSFHTIKFYHQEMTFANGLEYNVKPEGEVIAVPLTTNFDYSVSIPDEAKSWISLASSRAVPTKNETLTFTFSKNTSLYAGRSASVGIVPSNAREPLYYITFNQASANFSISKSRFAAPSGGGEFLADVTSTLGLKVSNYPDWIVPTVQLKANETTKFSLSLKVAANGTGAYRTGTVKLYTDNGTYLGTVEVSQLPVETSEMNKMVIKVSANQANKYTAVLPLSGTVQCQVDWGDGSGEELVTTSLPKHTYQTNKDVEYYDVKISGIVTRLNSSNIESTYKNAIYEIKQWGKTGLTSMEYAFDGCTNLRTVVADNSEAFENVTNFNYCFKDCIRLTTLFPNLFSYAINASTFKYAFSGCSGLVSVPGSLFANCKQVTDFSHVFGYCTALTTVPETLFSSCPLVKTFSWGFQHCTSLKTVPAGLFASNTEVTDFSGTFCYAGIESVPEDLFKTCVNVTTFSFLFGYCDMLVTIPAGLFRNCPEVQDFGGVFRSCHILKTVPVNIFDGNRRVTDFGEAFGYSYEIIGESPYTMINGKKVHLYERVDYPEYFITPTTYHSAFAGLKNLTDSAQIPSDWK